MDALPVTFSSLSASFSDLFILAAETNNPMLLEQMRRLMPMVASYNAKLFSFCFYFAVRNKHWLLVKDVLENVSHHSLKNNTKSVNDALRSA